MVATASSDQTVHIYRLDSLRYLPDLNSSLPLVLVLNGHQKWIWDIQFSADSAYLLTASSDHSCRLWECLSSKSNSEESHSSATEEPHITSNIMRVKQGETVRHYVGHDKAVIAVALHDIPL